MNTISHYLGGEHKRCDDLFATAETCVSNGDWAGADGTFKDFADGMECHFDKEEKILFLAFEKAIGSSEGPTAVMRMEHRQIRAILEQVREALEKRDADGFLGYSETLNTMIQQHNMKEESILYLMTDRVLSGEVDGILLAMSGIATAA